MSFIFYGSCYISCARSALRDEWVLSYYYWRHLKIRRIFFQPCHRHKLMSEMVGSGECFMCEIAFMFHHGKKIKIYGWKAVMESLRFWWRVKKQTCGGNQCLQLSRFNWSDGICICNIATRRYLMYCCSYNYILRMHLQLDSLQISSLTFPFAAMLYIKWQWNEYHTTLPCCAPRPKQKLVD